MRRSKLLLAAVLAATGSAISISAFPISYSSVLAEARAENADQSDTDSASDTASDVLQADVAGVGNTTSFSIENTSSHFAVDFAADHFMAPEGIFAQSWLTFSFEIASAAHYSITGGLQDEVSSFRDGDHHSGGPILRLLASMESKPFLYSEDDFVEALGEHTIILNGAVEGSGWVEGSPTGIIEPGTYAVHFLAQTGQEDGPNSPTWFWASSGARLELTPLVSAPEVSSSLLLLGFGVAGLALVRRKIS